MQAQERMYYLAPLGLRPLLVLSPSRCALPTPHIS